MVMLFSVSKASWPAMFQRCRFMCCWILAPAQSLSTLRLLQLVRLCARSVLMRRCWPRSDGEDTRLPLLSWGPGGRGLGRDRREHGGCVGLILLPEPIKDNSSTLQADDMVDWEDTLNACLLQDRDRPKMKPLEMFCS